MANRDDVVRSLAKLEAAFLRSLDPSERAVFVDHLMRFTDDELRGGVERALNSDLRTFPKLPQLVAFIGTDRSSRPREPQYCGLNGCVDGWVHLIRITRSYVSDKRTEDFWESYDAKRWEKLFRSTAQYDATQKVKRSMVWDEDACSASAHVEVGKCVCRKEAERRTGKRT